MYQINLRLVFAFIAVFLFPSWGFGQAPNFSLSDDSSKSIKIISISPDTSEPLNVGDTVDIEVEIEYAVDGLPATVGLNIQKGEMTGSGFDSVIASKTEVITQNRGTITLKQTVKVPNTSSIQIFTPVMSEGDTTIRTVDMRSYKVLSSKAGESASMIQFPSGESSVKILSISPDSSVPLYVGDTVEFEVKVEYEADKSPTTIALNIQKGEMTGNMLDAIATQMEVVTEQKGSVTLKQSIKVPNTSSIQVFTALMLESSAPTTTVDVRTYQVLKK